MNRKDYYQVLGVEENADTDAVKKAYRKLARKYHPDRHPGDKDASRRFKEVQEAYDVLGDAEKRGRYDQLRRAGASGAGGIDFDELFGGARGGGGDFGFGGSLFDLFERAGMGRSRATPRRGEDLAYSVTVDFETAAFGGKTTIRVPRTENCGDCGGSGAAPGSKAETCPACGGRGTTQTAQGAFAFSRPCPRCYGRGKVIGTPCPSCRGQGTREAVRTLDVTIPAGVDDGAKIRLRGEGESGAQGAPAGDLILTIRVRAHASIRRDGLDTESDLVIDFAEAALGTKRDVETLNGTVSLKIPAGVQPGTRMRMKGKGVVDHRGRAGDHYVKVKVEIPKRLTEKQRALLEEFRRESKEG